MYNTVAIPSEPIIPLGTSFCGFFTSSAAVLTASKPKKAKKTIAAPELTPFNPKGIKGVQLTGLT